MFLWCLKLGLLAFYSRFIDVFRWGKPVTDALWWFIIATFIAVFITILAECRPLSLMWALNYDDTKVACNRAVGNLILMAVCNIIINIALIILPFPMLRHLRLDIKEKLQLGFLFSVGAVLVAITILRLPLILNESVSQRSRSMWASIEILCACIVSNTPFFYALVKDMKRQHDDRPERSPSNATNPGDFDFYDLQSLPSSAGVQVPVRSSPDTSKSSLQIQYSGAVVVPTLRPSVTSAFNRCWGSTTPTPLPRLPSNLMPLQSTCSKDLQSPSSNNVKVISSTPTMLEQRVASWLESLPGEYLPSEALSKTSKRKAALPSPPTSDSMEGTTPKRRRLIDPDRTPRAANLPPPSSNGSSASWSESGEGSRSSSPKKQMLRLRLEERGLECRQLNVDTAPPVISSLLVSRQDLNTIEEIVSRIEILPADKKSAILESPLVREQNTRLWRFAFKEEGEDTLPGRVPLPEEIAQICDFARHCHDTNHEEAAWNMEVHHRLLQAILREPNAPKAAPLNFTSCTTARPHRRFVPYSSTAKMVDFCLYLKPTDSPALQALGRRTPTLTVNHTDFAPLQLSPIVLSIETKRPGKELDAAQLQMGVWHAAQWAFLRSVIGLTPQPLTAEEEILRSQKANDVLGQLGFIPGIIVQGHRWLFVFSTLEGDKTVLWTERQFGTTQSILDTYAVVAGIRELARWARDVYVPWFRANVLAGFQPTEVG
ncbi:hypothetical protein ACKAV7_013282 [Fusarium commune]